MAPKLAFGPIEISVCAFPMPRRARQCTSSTATGIALLGHFRRAQAGIFFRVSGVYPKTREGEMRRFICALISGVALTLLAAPTSDTAEAGWRGRGYYGGGGYYGGYRGYYGGGAYRGGAYRGAAYRGYYGGYRGYYRPYYRSYNYGYYRPYYRPAYYGYYRPYYRPAYRPYYRPYYGYYRPSYSYYTPTYYTRYPYDGYYAPSVYSGP
jgi:hypothetical protein